jgi:predicted PurR-regulated permease PerM
MVAAALVIVIAGLRAAGPILQPLLLARTGLAIFATVIADLVLLFMLGILISGAVNEFLATAPSYFEGLTEKVSTLVATLEDRGVPVSEWLVIEPIDPREYLDVAGGILGGTVRGVFSLVSDITLVAVGLIFVLFELVILPDKLSKALSGTDWTQHFVDIVREVQRYLGIKTAISVGTGLILGIWVALLGVDFPLLWGLAAFLLNYIPVLGPVIAAIPAVLVTLVQFGPARAIVLALGYLAVKVVIGDLLEPHLMGRRFGLSTAVVLVSLVFWGWVWGPLGMILSVPLTQTFKIAMEHSTHLKWVAVLLGPAPAAVKQTVAEESD